MADDRRYETALSTALAILHELAARPGMLGPQQLSTVTYLILRVIPEAEGPRPVPPCFEPGDN